jgi:hypothetical protein
LLVTILSGAYVLHAATEVTVDWQSGEVEVLKEEAPVTPAPPPESKERALSCEKENRRLRRIVETQQAIIVKQQQKLREQQATIRRQDDVIRGLDLLRRQGK